MTFNFDWHSLEYETSHGKSKAKRDYSKTSIVQRCYSLAAEVPLHKSLCFYDFLRVLNKSSVSFTALFL